MTNTVGKKKASLLLIALLAIALTFGMVGLAGCGKEDPKPEPPKESEKDKDKDKEKEEDKDKDKDKDKEGNKEEDKDKDKDKDKEGDKDKDKDKPKTQEDIDAMKVIAEKKAQELIDNGVAIEIYEILIFPADAPNGYVIDYLSSNSRKPATFTFNG